MKKGILKLKKIVDSDRSKRDVSHETIRILNFSFNRKLWLV